MSERPSSRTKMERNSPNIIRRMRRPKAVWNRRSRKTLQWWTNSRSTSSPRRSRPPAKYSIHMGPLISFNLSRTRRRTSRTGSSRRGTLSRSRTCKSTSRRTEWTASTMRPAGTHSRAARSWLTTGTNWTSTTGRALLWTRGRLLRIQRPIRFCREGKWFRAKDSSSIQTRNIHTNISRDSNRPNCETSRSWAAGTSRWTRTWTTRAATSPTMSLSNWCSTQSPTHNIQ